MRSATPAKAGVAHKPKPPHEGGPANADTPLAGGDEDVAATRDADLTHRVELVMLAQRRKADAGELAIDTMRTEFDLHEQERAELLREWNVMRDMALEQMKKDDEIVKKWIALI